MFFSSSNISHRLYHANNCANQLVFCLYIGGSKIEFLKDWPHLGHVITTNEHDDEHDIMSQMNNVVSF